MAIELHHNVATDHATRTVYATDNSIYQVTPAAVALPTSADEVVAIMQANARSDSPLPLVARGGGTGTNGQSLTPGLVVDVKRHLNRLLDVDIENRTARVQPGLVTSRFNDALRLHGLFWAPHTSTMNRATVGGMISTDAAGKGSLVHGRAHRHVLSLEVVLADGTPWTAEPITEREAEQRAQGDDSGALLWRKLLDLPIAEGADFALPELARGFSGYGIDRFRRDGLVDPVALICGAEGTLALITEATVRLTPIPAETMLYVASYPSFTEALDDAVELRATRPTAIETFDETTLERGRSSPAWPALGSVVGEHRGSVLLIEYSGDHLPEEAEVRAALAATGRSTEVAQLADPALRAQAWKVRSDAVGLLAKVAIGGPELSARPTAFVEDCVVPVEKMRSFIEGFRSVLDGAGVSYAMFGHADVGCVHVRPALDVTDPDHATLVRTITDQTVALVAEHGGVLWGEHGRGFRGESADVFLREDVVALMRAIKEAFDPTDQLNPGKLYRPSSSSEPLIALDAPPLRGELDRVVPVTLRRTFENAYACNGNGLCHHYDEAEVMCPSYKATGDPALSPKGRADLVRAWLRDRESATTAQQKIDLAAQEDALADNLDECLSCSACSGHCPVEVNIPELKSQFLEKFWESRKRPASHQLLSRFEQLAMLAARVPSALVGPFAGPVARRVGGPLGLVDLPAPKRATRSLSAPVLRFKPGETAPGDEAANHVVLLPDIFTSSLDPDVRISAIEVLRHLGYRVSEAPFIPSAKFDHVKGRRAAFAKAATAQAEMVASIVQTGAIPVGIEPAVTLLFAAEFAGAHPAPHWNEVRHVAELIAARQDRLPRTNTLIPITLMGHCTERATSPETGQLWADILRGVGYAVDAPDVGCCGMAGIFGHETANQAMSKKLWNLSWRGPAEQAEVLSAPGYSCRSQANRLHGSNDPVVEHPVQRLHTDIESR